MSGPACTGRVLPHRPCQWPFRRALPRRLCRWPYHLALPRRLCQWPFRQALPHRLCRWPFHLALPRRSCPWPLHQPSPCRSDHHTAALPHRPSRWPFRRLRSSPRTCRRRCSWFRRGPTRLRGHPDHCLRSPGCPLPRRHLVVPRSRSRAPTRAPPWPPTCRWAPAACRARCPRSPRCRRRRRGRRRARPAWLGPAWGRRCGRP
mmetsp:Transcript_47881/g.104385  ORF Transcript_47881/g.104385 Transcript_47881/m.104385 type:complete len:204 (+) Transcript_47881:1058-1669(+)